MFFLNLFFKIGSFNRRSIAFLIRFTLDRISNPIYSKQTKPKRFKLSPYFVNMDGEPYLIMTKSTPTPTILWAEA